MVELIKKVYKWIILLHFLLRYKKYSEEYKLPENPSDKESGEYICKFKKQIGELEPNAIEDSTIYADVALAFALTVLARKKLLVYNIHRINKCY